MSDDFEIVVVDDELCPNKACQTPGSPKVADRDGTWWWKCLAANCFIGYWVPGTNRIERRPPPAEAEAIAARVKAEVEEQLRGRRWICRSSRSGISESTTIPEGDPLPEGYHELGSDECRAHNG